MTDAASTIETGLTGTLRESTGLHVDLTRDIKWTSAISNGTAGKTVTAQTLGVTRIVGVDFIGDVGADYSATDTIGQVTAVIAAGGASVVLTGLTAAGVALDLDAADIAVARVVFRCAP